MRHALLWLIVLSGLCACTDNIGQSQIDTYQERLLNVLSGFDIDFPEVTDPPESLAYPQRKDRISVLEVESSNIDLLDFLSLYGCQLQVVVAEANSALGKVAPDSQRLIFALQFLQYAPECIERIEQKGSGELAAQLKKETERKRTLLPYIIAKATLGSEEFRQFWKPPIDLEKYPLEIGIEPLQAIGRLEHLARGWLAGNYAHGQQDIEVLLSKVLTGDGGALHDAHQLLLQRLRGMNVFLGRVLDSPALCARPNLFSRPILANVVQTFFVNGVQDWAAQLNRRSYQIQSAIHPLEKLLENTASEELRQWQWARDAIHAQVKTELQMHVSHLQVLLEEEQFRQHCNSHD